MFKFSEKRMIYEEQQLEENKDQLPPNVQYKCENRYHYKLQIKGLNGTVHESIHSYNQDAYIIIDIELNGYPVDAPQITFLNNFQHVNVFPMGKLCLYLTNKETWTSDTSLIDIFSGINQVIHHPTFHDPANSTYKDPIVYEREMKKQATRLKDEKYKIL